MEASLQELKASPRMVPRAVYLPNCDRKGFYKRKQVCPAPARKPGGPLGCPCQKTSTSKCPGSLALAVVFPDPPTTKLVPPSGFNDSPCFHEFVLKGNFVSLSHRMLMCYFLMHTHINIAHIRL